MFESRPGVVPRQRQVGEGHRPVLEYLAQRARNVLISETGGLFVRDGASTWQGVRLRAFANFLDQFRHHEIGIGREQEIDRR
jgi:hypothetical protein